MANIINLNNICKIVLRKKEKTDDFKWVTRQTFSQWFMNLFRKDKLTTSYVKFRLKGDCYIVTDIEKDLLGEEWFNKKYEYNSATKIFFKKPHVALWYSDFNHSYEIRYFESNKEATDYFNKLNDYAQKQNVPFINMDAGK